VPAERADRIAMRAKQYLDEVAGFDREAEAVVFEPDMMAS
jgi:hypothetical protein